MFVTRPLLCQDRQPNAERKRCTMGNRGGESRLTEGVYAEGKEKGGKRSKGKVRLSEEWRATLFSTCTLSLIWPIIYSTKAVDKWQLLVVSPSSSNRIPTKWILNYMSSERSVNNNEKNNVEYEFGSISAAAGRLQLTVQTTTKVLTELHLRMNLSVYAHFPLDEKWPLTYYSLKQIPMILTLLQHYCRVYYWGTYFILNT